MADSQQPIHHGFYEVFIPVTDLDRSMEFYNRLGFRLGWRDHSSSALLLHNDGGTRSMLGLTHVDVVSRSHHLSFRVFHGDVDAMVPYLHEKGIATIHPSKSPVQGEMKEPVVHGWMPAASVFFKDPDGHLLELIADLPDPPRPDVFYCPLSEWRERFGNP
jgi:lactoylglutathione lyase